MATLARRSDMRVPHEWRTTLATVAALAVAAAVMIALLVALARNIGP